MLRPVTILMPSGTTLLLHKVKVRHIAARLWWVYLNEAEFVWVEAEYILPGRTYTAFRGPCRAAA